MIRAVLFGLGGAFVVGGPGPPRATNPKGAAAPRHLRGRAAEGGPP